MEDVLDVYKRAHSEAHPLIGMDESSKQQVKEIRTPLPVESGQPQKYDSEYERNGVSNLFLFLAPLLGWRHVKVTDQRTRVDWAHAMKELVAIHFPQAEKICVVMDNLNTHHPASLYAAFSPQEARRIIDKLELHYTPKHGSWLNMAEMEFSVLQRQCLDRRIPDQQSLINAVAAWQTERNEKQVQINWRFTAADARIKLKRLYPVIQSGQRTSRLGPNWVPHLMSLPGFGPNMLEMG